MRASSASPRAASRETAGAVEEAGVQQAAAREPRRRVHRQVAGDRVLGVRARLAELPHRLGEEGEPVGADAEGDADAVRHDAVGERREQRPELRRAARVAERVAHLAQIREHAQAMLAAEVLEVGGGDGIERGARVVEASELDVDEREEGPRHG